MSRPIAAAAAPHNNPFDIPKNDSKARKQAAEELGLEDPTLAGMTARLEGHNLSEYGRRYLQQRGIAPEVAKARGVYTITSTTELPLLLKGTWSTSMREHLDSNGIEAIVVPWFQASNPDRASTFELKYNEERLITDQNGKVLDQIKCDLPLGAHDGIELGDIPLDVHVHSPSRAVNLDGDAVCLLTEGALKASAIASQTALEGWSAYIGGMKGVWQGVLGKDRRDTFRPQLGPAFDPTVFHRPTLTIYLIPDSDGRTNWSVREAMVDTALALASHLSPDKTPIVRIVDLPVIDGVGNGVDDHIAYMREVDPDGNHMANLLRDHSVDWLEWARQTAFWEHNDVGRSERLVSELLHEHCRYVPAYGLLAWNGTHYEVDEEENHMYTALKTCAGRIISKEGKADTEKQRTKAKSTLLLKAASSLAYKHPDLRAAIADLDSHPLLLNTTSGTVDLQTGVVGLHDPKHLITACTKSGCDPTIPIPVWLGFLNDTFQGRQDTIAYFQRWAGMMLTGETRSAEFLLIAHGEGDNGKSTLFNFLLRILGTYGTQLDPDVLTGDAPYEKVKVRAKLFALLAEWEQGQILSPAELKRLCSSDPITARAIYKAPIVFTPTHSTAMFTNHLPIIRSTDHGTWKRLGFLKFANHVPPGDPRRDPYLSDKLDAEADGVMAWLVGGAVEYLANGVGTCSDVDDAKAEYRVSTDLLGQFLDERTIIGKTERCNKAAFYQVFRNWMLANGHQPWTAQTLGRSLRERGVIGPEERRSNGIRYYLGINIGPYVSWEPDPQNPPVEDDNEDF